MSTPGSKPNIKNTPEYQRITQVIEKDTLEQILAIHESEANSFPEEADAIRALLIVPTLMVLDLLKEGSNFSLMRIPDKSYENGTLTGPAVEVFRKCEELGLQPKIVSKYYHEDFGVSHEGHRNFFQLQITTPIKTDP